MSTFIVTIIIPTLNEERFIAKCLDSVIAQSYPLEYMDIDKLNTLGINKAIVEFLRVNTWIKKWFNIDYSKFTLKEGGYNHLPLEEKKRILAKITIPNISVCEDVQEHYNYWRDNFNPNKDDCCNLIIKKDN